MQTPLKYTFFFLDFFDYPAPHSSYRMHRKHFSTQVRENFFKRMSLKTNVCTATHRGPRAGLLGFEPQLCPFQAGVSAVFSHPQVGAMDLWQLT